MTVAGKPLRDHEEVVGHARAIELVYALLDRAVVTEQDLFDLHKSVMTDTVIDTMSPVGAYKREPNSTNAIAPNGRQVVIEFPSADRTPALMTKWLERFNALAPTDRSNALQAYVVTHLEFVSIHPLCDGNGRLARLIANLPVLRAGFPPLVVPTERRMEYLRAIAAYQLSIPDYPYGDQLPANPRQDAFAALCLDFRRETWLHVEEAQRLQRARSATGV